MLEKVGEVFDASTDRHFAEFMDRPLSKTGQVIKGAGEAVLGAYALYAVSCIARGIREEFKNNAQQSH